MRPPPARTDSPRTWSSYTCHMSVPARMFVVTTPESEKTAVCGVARRASRHTHARVSAHAVHRHYDGNRHDRAGRSRCRISSRGGGVCVEAAAACNERGATRLPMLWHRTCPAMKCPEAVARLQDA